MRKHLILAAKVVWMVAIAAVLVWYLTTHWDEFVDYAEEVGPGSIVISVVLILAAKLLLAQVSLEALRMFAVRLSFAKAFAIYSLAQMGKYLPGSIWHFVGRILLYRLEGLPGKQGTKLLVIENIWLLGSAAAFGAAACSGRLLSLLRLDAVAAYVHPAIISVLIVVIWFAVMWWATVFLARRFRLPDARLVLVFALEAGTWVLLGLSFWILLPPDLRTASSAPLAVGAFALGWAGGYVAPFAPSGVGVREAIIVLLIGTMTTTPVAVAAVSLGRIVYSGVELALGGIAALRYQSTTREIRKMAAKETPAEADGA